MARGMALVTEDRKETGCFLALSVLENLEISVLTATSSASGSSASAPLRRPARR